MFCYYGTNAKYISMQNGVIDQNVKEKNQMPGFIVS